VLDDTAVSKELGLTKRTVQGNRLKLIKNNYFFELRTKGVNSEGYYYFLGKDAVIRIKFYDELFNAETAYQIRRKCSPEEAMEIALKALLSDRDYADLIATLKPKNDKERKSSPSSWRSIK